MSRNAYKKSQLFLLEFIIVVLFFAICSAICVSAFVKADNLSLHSREKNKAVIAMQSAAECIKSVDVASQAFESRGPVEEAQALLGECLQAEPLEETSFTQAACVVYYDPEFEPTDEKEAAHSMHISLQFRDRFLTADIKMDDLEPLHIKKYIPGGE